MPLQRIPGTEAIATLLLHDTGDGHLWGENLMRLTGQIPVSNGIIADDFARFVKHR